MSVSSIFLKDYTAANPGNPTATPAVPATPEKIGDAKFVLTGIEDHFKPLQAAIDKIPTTASGAGIGGVKGFFTHAGAGAVGASPAIIASGIAAWKSWTADAKLNKAEAAINHKLGTLTKDVKVPGWLKASAIATLVVSLGGLVAGASKNAGHKAAQRVL